MRREVMFSHLSVGSQEGGREGYPSLWSLILYEGERGYPSLWSLILSQGGRRYPSQTRRRYPLPPPQDQDRGIPSPKQDQDRGTPLPDRTRTRVLPLSHLPDRTRTGEPPSPRHDTPWTGYTTGGTPLAFTQDFLVWKNRPHFTTIRVRMYACLLVAPLTFRTKFRKFHRISKIPKRDHVSCHSEQL